MSINRRNLIRGFTVAPAVSAAALTTTIPLKVDATPRAELVELELGRFGPVRVRFYSVFVAEEVFNEKTGACIGKRRASVGGKTEEGLRLWSFMALPNALEHVARLGERGLAIKHGLTDRDVAVVDMFRGLYTQCAWLEEIRTAGGIAPMQVRYRPFCLKT